MVQSARVDAVKKFASEHKDDAKWAKVVEMDDLTLYNVVKHTQSPEGAVRKVAREIQSPLGADMELPAPTQTQAQAEAEKKLQEIAGVEPSEHPDPYAVDAEGHHTPPAREIRTPEARQAVRRPSRVGREGEVEAQHAKAAADKAKTPAKAGNGNNK